MTVAVASLIAFLLLFGLLALPYSVVIAGGSWLMAVGIFALSVIRRREKAQLALGTIAVVCVLGVLGWTLVLMPWANEPVVSDMTTLNLDGESGRALVVYHPGRSELQ